MVAPAIPARLLVVGFGLLGGSVALAARERSPATRVATVDPDPQARLLAERWGIEAHAACPDRVEHEIIVVCAPFDGCLRALGDLAPRMAGDAVVTDVAGLKAALVRHAASLAKGYPRFRYVGAHPLSGSHLRGAEHARSNLLDDAPCALVSMAAERAEPEARAEAFWRALGCRTVWMGAAEHDEHVAATSALPQIVSAALAAAVRQRVGGEGALLAGPGLRDATRLAGAPPELWAGILNTNRDAILGALRFFGEQCERWEKALRSGQRDAIQRLLEEDRQARWTLFPPAEKDGARAG